VKSLPARLPDIATHSTTPDPPTNAPTQVGGSLSALFTSLSLLHLPPPSPKHRITILERSPTPLLHDQGAGVVAGGDTLYFFQKHDVFEREIAVESQERLYLDKNGKVIDRESYRQKMTSWDLLYYLSRGGVDGTESGYVDKGKWEVVSARGDVREAWGRARYEYGRQVVGVEEKGGKVEVRWKSTRQEEEGVEGREVADFLICADGPSSRLRGMVMQGASQRVYAGYVAFRGTVPEGELSWTAKDVFVERFTFYHADGVQILAYTIPGVDGSLEKGKRKVNWVWYWNCDESGDEYKEILTDTNGNFHRFTLPTGGKMQGKVWDRQKQRTMDILPPQFAEIVERTEKPFVQAITDVEPPQKGTKVGRLLNGKAALVGDALAGFRPHTAASTSQAAFDALMLEEVFTGQMTWDEYEKRVLDFAWSWQQRGVMLGERSQFGRHPLARGGGAEKVSREQLHMRRSK
jgi:2-polyprenyl-6-methoxyphenol hydroxylase-like FAD-dependent oxidoreductase